MHGIIKKIRLYPEKHSAGVEISEAFLIENEGLKGDFHATGGERQISLLFTQPRNKTADQKEKGLCHSRFKENICIFGLTPDCISVGMRLEFKDAVLEISGETKYCHTECPLFESGTTCSLAGLNLFAKVIKSGIIRIDDEVHINTNNSI